MTTYTISLDDVDLALLPSRMRPNDFLKKELYQFQVLRETPRETSVTYTCHTCAIDVPTAFASEHIASVKHQANTHIAREAMQRTSAGISCLPLTHAASSSALFCANCAIAVDENHEKTKEHRVAAMHDNLLWELMKAYVGDEVTSEDREKLRKSKDDDKNGNNDAATRRVVEEQKLNTGDKTEIDYIQRNPENCEAKVKLEKINEEAKGTNSINNLARTNDAENNQACSSNATSKGCVKLTNKQVNENGIIQNGANMVETINEITKNMTTNGEIGDARKNLNKDHYAKELLKFMDTDNIFEINEAYNRMLIKCNDETLNVYSDHFHSYHRIFTKDKKIECAVCDRTFSYRDEEMHKYDLNHMSMVAKIGDDGHYVRKINNAYSHCILCNQKIRNDNIATHKKSQHHSIRKVNNVKHCKPKNTETKSNKEAITNKGTDNPEKANNDKDKRENAQINGGSVNDPYEEVSGELRCVVCDCKVPKDTRNRQDHLKGLRHVNNLKL